MGNIDCCKGVEKEKEELNNDAANTYDKEGYPHDSVENKENIVQNELGDLPKQEEIEVEENDIKPLEENNEIEQENKAEEEQNEQLNTEQNQPEDEHKQYEEHELEEKTCRRTRRGARRRTTN